MGDRSFMAATPRLWNSLPLDIRSACTISDFEQKRLFFSAMHFVRTISLYLDCFTAFLRIIFLYPIVISILFVF